MTKQPLLYVRYDKTITLNIILLLSYKYLSVFNTFARKNGSDKI